MEKYQEIYGEFMKKYNKSETSPSEVGEILARIAGYFPSYNMTMINIERDFSIVHKGIAEGTDEATGKAISSVKAGIIADASTEAFDFKTAKGHVQNIEMLIGVLKFLQKSLETEYLSSNV